ncbi:MAG: hypothetical protein ACREBF_02020 [Candidatus Micrarchaeales archaeon]
MKIGGIEIGMSNKDNAKKYSCWGCRKTYLDPKEFLWHTQFCEDANNRQDFLIVKVQA